jgi:GT2 family glycosyltransferase
VAEEYYSQARDVSVRSRRGFLRPNNNSEKAPKQGDRSKRGALVAVEPIGPETELIQSPNAILDRAEKSEKPQGETVQLAAELDDAKRKLGFYEKVAIHLQYTIEFLHRRIDGADAEAEGLRSQLASLTERLENAEGTTSTAEDVARYLSAGFRELESSAASDLGPDQTNIARQLIYLWAYTIADREPMRRALQLRGGGTGLGSPTRKGTLRLGFYRQLTTQDTALLRAEIAASGLFDPDWYRQNYPQCEGAAEIWEYFVRIGLAEDHDPHPLFDTEWYRTQTSAEALRGEFPLLHFLREGGRAGLSPHPLFDAAWYLEKNSDVAENPLAHFIARGAAQGCSPHPAFDIEWYRQARGPALPEGGNPLVDYLTSADARFVSPHPLFDVNWFLAGRSAAHPRLANLLIDYLDSGVAEDRSPHPLFDTLWYLMANRDAADSTLHPLVHFLRSAPAACRQTSPWFDAEWYRNEYPDVAASGLHSVVHYVTRGRAEARELSASTPLRNLRSLARQSGAALPPMLAYVTGANFRAESIPAKSPSGVLAKHGVKLPNGSDYWLPDRLREYIIGRFGAPEVPFLREMMAIIARNEGDRTNFAETNDCRWLLTELQEAAIDSEPEAQIDVSIVIPVFNGLVFTLTCLRSLFKMTTGYRFEVLVGDDASTDGTDAVLPAIGGRVRYLRHPENLGFLLNCNITSLRARGRHIVLLNNDVIILPRWLDELIGILDSDPQIGLAGSKLLNGDGSLQEAGGIYWNDGSAWNFGRGQDPRLPEFNYVKEADYCSGASIALPTAVWKDLRGFDLAYVPAYCEDADLAFRVRAAGFKAVYQPFSEIVHHEGKSNGTDTSSGIKAYQLLHLEKLRLRWSQTLAVEHLPWGEHLFLARDRSGPRPHVLFVDHYIPKRDQDCGSRLISLYIKMFVEAGFQVTFWPDNLHEDPDYIRTLQKGGVEVIYSNRYRGKFDSWIKENGKYFSYIFLSRPHIATYYINSARSHSAATIMYYGHDIHWQRVALEYKLTGNRVLLAEIDRWRDIETKVCEASDVIFYPSQEECDLIRRQFPDKAVIELPVAYFGEEFGLDPADISTTEAQRDPFHLMFVGGFGHAPNIDAMMWFVSKIFPRLQKRDARFHLTIVGSEPPEAIKSLVADRIEVTGYISDAALAELYRKAGVAVAPLRYGAGVKGKVIESFAFGIPMVTTNIGMQGIDEAETAFVADDASGFVKQVCRAATDRAAACGKVASAYRFLKRKYSREYVQGLLARVVVELDPAFGAEGPRPSSQLTTIAKSQGFGTGSGASTVKAQRAQKRGAAAVRANHARGYLDAPGR